jgi:hypothetical protein
MLNSELVARMKVALAVFRTAEAKATGPAQAALMGPSKASARPACKVCAFRATGNGLDGSGFMSATSCNE